MYSTIETVNGQKTGADALSGLFSGNTLAKDLQDLKAEGIKLGVISA
jgi:hypothetical protein